MSFTGGYNFKRRALTIDQRKVLQRLKERCDTDSVSMWRYNRQHTYLLSTGGKIAVFGISSQPLVDQEYDMKHLIGVVWHSKEIKVLEILLDAKLEYFFPYKVDPNRLYYIKNGEFYYEQHTMNGSVIDTPKGLGKVWSLDHDGVVCVELDNEHGILHEFQVNELRAAQ